MTIAHWAGMSGMSRTTFYRRVRALEKAGFPLKSPWKDKRFIPVIKAFWYEHHNAELPDTQESIEDEKRAKENWDDPPRPRGRKPHVTCQILCTRGTETKSDSSFASGAYWTRGVPPARRYRLYLSSLWFR